MRAASRQGRCVRRLTQAVQASGLIERGDRMLVAVSGGPDSVALLSVLHALAPSLNLMLSVAHFNYGLRGAESDEDAAFVVRLSEYLAVPCFCESVPVASGWEGRSVQEAAREARYAALLRLSESIGANKIAIGHTRDDQAETVILWLLRGAGSTGLSGMPAMRLPFIRPLLSVTRREVLAYLAEQALEFREDSSNAESIYMRNRVRHDVLPLLKQLNPAIVDGLTRQADILREDDRCLDDQADACVAGVARAVGKDEWVVSRSALLTLPLALQRRVVRKTLQRLTDSHQGPSYTGVSLVLDRVVHGESGACVTVRHAAVSREYDAIRFQSVDAVAAVPADLSHALVALAVPSAVFWSPTGQWVHADLVHCSPSAEHIMALSSEQAMVDADRVTLDLQVRAWQPGDRLHPFGLQGHRKKLQDIFADLKISRSLRARIPLIVAPEGIVWVGGYRTDHRFRVTASTERVLHLTVSDRERREPA